LQHKSLATEIQNTSNATLRTTTSLHSHISNIKTQLTEEFEPKSGQTLQAVQGLRNDFSELRQMEITEYRSIRQILINIQAQSVVFDGRRGIVGNGRRQSALATDIAPSSRNYSGKIVQYEESETCLVLHLPIGSLHYCKNHSKSRSSSLGSSDKDRERERSTTTFLFVPASWISKQLFRTSFEFLTGRDLNRTLSVRLSSPGKICSDRKVLESMGYRKQKGESCDSYGGSIDPKAFRRYLRQGHFGPNDLVLDEYLGLINILEVS
jgi:hypothetical protein